MVNAETYGRVKSFCYLGDTLYIDGGALLAATASIRNGWMKFRELWPFLTCRGMSETWPFLADVRLKFERAEIQMIGWMCEVSMKDRTSKELRKLVGVEPITTVIRSGGLRGYGHVMRKNYEDWVKTCMEYRVEGRRLVGRPRRTWLEIVESDLAELEIDREDDHDRKNVAKKTDNKPIIT